jgi:hypothetical protein
VAQAVERLLCKDEALSSYLSPTEKKLRHRRVKCEKCVNSKFKGTNFTFFGGDGTKV